MINEKAHIIISGGGTGGHVFPAISIANAVKKRMPGAEVLFVGARGKLEMEKVPAAGYKITGLPIAGFQRSWSLKNLSFFFKLWKSLRLSRKIIRQFNPDVVVGVGGYASGPVLYKANKAGIPTLIQEQNSYAGITNKLLAKKASVICTAYDGMEKYFPASKIVLTGNPVREDLVDLKASQEEAKHFFGLEKDKKMILVIGGSLGARTINRSIQKQLKNMLKRDVQWLWQTGKLYYEESQAILAEMPTNQILVKDFIKRMDMAYAAADLIISRAGAGTISELSIVGKPVILVPSPNVAEDHQTKNARALANNQAAIMVKDQEAEDELVEQAFKIIDNIDLQQELSEHIKKFALPNAAGDIAKHIHSLIENRS